MDLNLDSYQIIEIEGIGEVYAKRLNDIGIQNTLELLQRTRTPQDRENLADETGISSKLILEWANIADLMRIKGIGEEWSDLLEEVGVDTVIELSIRNSDNLYEIIQNYDISKSHLVRRKPGKEQIANWIEQAKGLDRMLEYYGKHHSIESITVDNQKIIAGGSTVGTVALSNPAPAGGANITLSGYEDTGLEVPDKVFIPEGETHATFDIEIPSEEEEMTVTIIAIYEGEEKQLTVTVVPSS